MLAACILACLVICASFVKGKCFTKFKWVNIVEEYSWHIMIPIRFCSLMENMSLFVTTKSIYKLYAFWTCVCFSCVCVHRVIPIAIRTSTIQNEPYCLFKQHASSWSHLTQVERGGIRLCRYLVTSFSSPPVHTHCVVHTCATRMSRCQSLLMQGDVVENIECSSSMCLQELIASSWQCSAMKQSFVMIHVCIYAFSGALISCFSQANSLDCTVNEI